MLKQISPTHVPVAPKDSPSKHRPSSRAISVFIGAKRPTLNAQRSTPNAQLKIVLRIYGRGGGLGRSLGVGANLGVGEGLGVEVGVAIGVAVGVGVRLTGVAVAVDVGVGVGVGVDGL